MKCKNNYIIEANIKRGLRLDKAGRIILANGFPFMGKSINRGYRAIGLHMPGKRQERTTVHVARVICWLTYGPPPTEHHEVDHINRNRLDDRPENLRWATHSENLLNVSNNVRVARQKRGRKIGRGRKHT